MIIRGHISCTVNLIILTITSYPKPLCLCIDPLSSASSAKDGFLFHSNLIDDQVPSSKSDLLNLSVRSTCGLDTRFPQNIFCRMFLPGRSVLKKVLCLSSVRSRGHQDSKCQPFHRTDHPPRFQAAHSQVSHRTSVSWHTENMSTNQNLKLSRRLDTAKCFMA